MKNRHPEQIRGEDKEPEQVRNERENIWKISVTLKKQLATRARKEEINCMTNNLCSGHGAYWTLNNTVVTTHGNNIQSAVMSYL